MDLMFLDLETYYDDDYTLKKMTTMEYIRDPRWGLLGVAVAINQSQPIFKANDPYWHPPHPKDGQFPQRGHALMECFRKSHKWENTIAVAHNAAFDGGALWHHYGIRPARWIDTVLLTRWAIGQGHLPPDASMGLWWWGEYLGMPKGDTEEAVRAGGRELAQYAERDIHITREALRRLMAMNPPQMELDLIDLHVRMAAEPMLALDEDLLTEAANQEPSELVRAVRKNDNFVAALRARGVEPGTKISERTGKETFAFAKTDAFMLSLHRHADPVVRELASLRTAGGSNIVRTRARTLLKVGPPLPIPLLYYGGHTGRASGEGGYNPQNMPTKGPLRRSIMAPEGYVLVVVDLKQIEVRQLAYLAGEQHMLDTFARGEDPYARFCVDHLYQQEYRGDYEGFLELLKAEGPAADAARLHRKISKSAVLALGFHQGPNGFLGYCESFKVPMDEATARRVVRVYREVHQRTMAFGYQCLQEVQRTGALQLLCGRRLTYPDMAQGRDGQTYQRPLIFSKYHKGKRDVVNLWVGRAVNPKVQAEARDVVMWQTLELAKLHRVVLSVHDEAVACVPIAQAEQAQADATRLFSTPPPWAPGLLVEGEVSTAVRYGDAK